MTYSTSAASDAFHVTTDEYCDMISTVIKEVYGRHEGRWHPEDIGCHVTVASDIITAAFNWYSRHWRGDSA